MKFKILFILFLFVLNCSKNEERVTANKLDISSQLLLEVKRSNPTDSLESLISNLEESELISTLDTDNKKKAFWLNIYNAYYQIMADKGSYSFDSIFVKKLIPIAGDTISFDALEHGILRAKKEYDFGSLAVDTIDYRIHFALNCGAKSCPPIAFYNASKIDQQLETATKLYLTLDTEVREDSKTIVVTQLMEWFSEDFGGEEGVVEALEKYLGTDYSGYTIIFKPFDWSQKLSNFK